MRPYAPEFRGPVVEDRYEILETIGSGRQALIFLAYDHVRGRSVAVKTNALSRDGCPSALRHEANMLAGIEHPCVVQLLDTVELGGCLGLVLELAAGGAVRDWMRRHGGLDPRAALEIALQIAVAAEHVHATGVLHRDLKPGNVLVRSDGTVMLADFGVACDADHPTLGRHGTACIGTPNFMAPEQQLGVCEIDHRCDVYGLGATLHRMITNRAERWLFRCVRATYLLRGLPAPIAELVAECCRLDPRDRPPDMAAVQARLIDALASVPPGPGTPPLGAWPQRTRPVVRDRGVEALRELVCGPPRPIPAASTPKVRRARPPSA